MSKYDELKWLAEEVQMSAAGTWTLQTGCSWRRIGNEFGDGNVLRPCAHQHDGWPDLSAAPYVLEYLIAAQPSAILELIAENERNERMLLAACMDMGAIGEALGADMNSDGEELLSMVVDMKAENKRLRDFICHISRTSGDKGAVMGARELLKEFDE